MGQVRCRSRSAFTLAELAIVVAIIGIVAAMAVPRLSGVLARRRADHATRRIVTDLEYASRRAVLTSTSQSVQFDVDADRYVLPGTPHPDDPDVDYEVVLSDEPYRMRIESADFGGDAVVVFDIYGNPDSTGSVVLDFWKTGDSADVPREVALGTTTSETTIKKRP